MDYVVGSVAALLSGAGNTTPNRPRLVKRALTPTKHQPSPNVTPKSEFVDDRSIFLSPTLQKKKAIVKKSPKRIFQNPDLEVTNDGEGTFNLLSPKADKAKKHLKDDLEANTMGNNTAGKVNSPKKGKNNPNKHLDSALNSTKLSTNDIEGKLSQTLQVNNESTPRKKKKQRNSVSLPCEGETNDENENLSSVSIKIDNKSPKKGKRKSASNFSEVAVNQTATVSTENGTPKKKKRKSMSQDIEKSVSIDKDNEILNKIDNNEKKRIKKNKKQKKSQSQEIAIGNEDENVKAPAGDSPAKKKNKRRKKKSKKNQNLDAQSQQLTPNDEKKSKVNPNAVTNMDSDSEHESDDEINSDTEQINKEILDTGPASSDDEQDNEEVKKPQKEVVKNFDDAEVIRRTLFVGNVPFSKKCKKEIKNIFNKYGHVENVR